ncbi:SRPBCC family protein [Actinomadura scrupuli]|uniref:SRPBCC family protein n=1 Tax=Actinomadura scrupuli TaxID=559629 RepID=UPI003D956197
MKVNGSATVAAPVGLVWDALQDPAVLVRTIPGCRRLEATGADTYKMTVTAGVASIKGTYVGQVALAEPDPPHSFVLRAQGQGAPGTVDATVLVRLSDGDGGTRIDYAADAVVGGMIGGVGQRMLSTVAKRTAGEFFAAVERALTEQPIPAEAGVSAGPQAPVGPGTVSAPPAATGAVAAAPAGMGTVYAAPAAERAAGPAAAAAMTAAFVAGGVIALGGVAVGYLMGRRARR